MSLLLLVAGGLFAVIFSLNNLIQTARRAKVGYWDIQLAFLVTLVSAAALIVNYWGDAPDTQIDAWALVGGLVLAGASLIIVLLELFRPQRLKASRGVLGIFAGLLVTLASIGVPFASAYFALQSLPTPAPTTVALAGGTTESTAEATTEALSRGASLFYAIRDVILEEIDVDDQIVTDALEAGTPLRQIVEQYGGDIEPVIAGISAAMDAWVREGLALGEIPSFQAALLLSQMENIVRLAVNMDINQFANRFGRATPAPGETQESVFGLVSPPPVTVIVVTATPGADSSTTVPTATTASPTAATTASPTASARPSNTPTPSRTRYTFSTRTPVPTLTPTEALICRATVSNNLRLRAGTSQDAETLLTIPADAFIFLDGRTADNLWWHAEYEGQTGWVFGEYLLLAAACEGLPVLEG